MTTHAHVHAISRARARAHTFKNLHRNSIGEPLHKFVNIPKRPPTSGHFSILHLRSARFPLTSVLNHIYFEFQLFALIRAKRIYRP